MKVIMIIDNLNKGGKERRILELLRSFENRLDYKLFLVILSNQIEYKLIRELKNTELIILQRKIKKDPLVYFRLWAICKRIKPDIIHSWGSMPSVYAFSICYFRKIPFLNGMITNAFCKKYSSTWFRAKITFPFSDIVLSNSYAGIKAYPVPLTKARVIYNGIHLDRFVLSKTTEEIRAQKGIHTRYVIGMVGAFHPRKDFETFLNTAIRIAQTNKEITFLAIGDGAMLKRLKNMVPDNLYERIKFTGLQEKVEEFISIMDIGILLTNTNHHQEGLSNVIIEYMALGKPVIASLGGGTNELVKNSVNGFLIQPGNSLELEEKINFLLNNLDMTKEMGKINRETIENSFNINNMTELFCKIYDELNQERIENQK